MFEDRFFNKALQLLKSTDNSYVKIGVLNLIINLAYKDSESAVDSKSRKAILDLNLNDMLEQMKDKERDPEVKGYLARTIKSLG